MRPFLPALLLLSLGPYSAAAFDEIALTAGWADANGQQELFQDTRLVRLTAVQTRYTAEEPAGAWSTSGSWEFDVGYWHWNNDRHPHREGHLWELAATPVFRLDRLKPFPRLQPFLEAAIGVHLISETDVSRRELSTNFHFGSHVGAGMRFGPAGRYELTFRYQHLSNAGIRSPNPGVNLYLTKFGYRLH